MDPHPNHKIHQCRLTSTGSDTEANVANSYLQLTVSNKCDSTLCVREICR
jgi:hypothetical protein